jgi:prepilin-type N-terminal cleavage/methylation domain-containing protein
MKIKAQLRAGFTLLEVSVAAALAALLFGAVFKAYTEIGRRVQFAAYTLAAHTAAMQQLEQSMAAQWAPSSGVTTLFSTYASTVSNTLYLPNFGDIVVPYTNFITISNISASPPYAMVRVDCVWCFADMGVYTNTVAIIRAP